jgi:hypothetical protein
VISPETELEKALHRFAKEKLVPHREAIDFSPHRPARMALRTRLAEIGAFDAEAIGSFSDAVRAAWALSTTCAGAGSLSAWDVVGQLLAKALGAQFVAPVAFCLPSLDGDLAAPIAPDVTLEGGALRGKVPAVPLASVARTFAVVTARDGALAVAWAECGEKVLLSERLGQLGVRALPCADVAFEGAAPRSVQPLDPAQLLRVLGAYALVSSACACSTALAAQVEARTYARERYQGGSTIDRHEPVELLLGPNEAAMLAARQAILAFAEAADRGEAESWRAILRARSGWARAAIQAASDAIQVLGGYGYMRDYGLEKRYRDAVALSLLPADGTRLALAAAALG